MIQSASPEGNQVSIARLDGREPLGSRLRQGFRSGILTRAIADDVFDPIHKSCGTVGGRIAVVRASMLRHLGRAIRFGKS